MQAKDIYENLKAKFGDSILSFIDTAAGDPYIEVQTEKILDTCLYLRDNDDMSFDFLASLSGMHLHDQLCVIYHLYSLKLNHRVTLKLYVPKKHPQVPTVERCWRTADWHERETWDLMGVDFVGHHDLQRILCPDDWEGHPLRKDYKAPEFYHGIKVS